jgi:OmpA-OmpF porin, OOP family
MSRAFAVVSAATLCIASAGIAQAQQTTPPPPPGSDTGFRLPYERGFWGHVGINAGRSRLRGSPCVSGFSCDDRDTMWRAYAGGKFNNAIGAEIGYLDLGKFERGGGKTDAHGADIAFLAGIPLGQNWSIFGKLGTAYLRTNVTGATGAALTTGHESGWGPRYGIGVQAGITRNWAVRVDADRYRIQLPGAKENVDTLTAGVQYSFR